MFIGHGYDVHRFSEIHDNGGIILGGVHIDYDYQLLAHSDGDVLLHAIMDALLGAAALGDIGQHFPDTDSALNNINSRELLCQVVQLLKQEKLSVHNIDATIVAQVPKMSPHILSMRKNIAEDLKVDMKFVNVKATTTEKLGFIGEKKGIAVHAVSLLKYNNFYFFLKNLIKY